MKRQKVVRGAGKKSAKSMKKKTGHNKKSFAFNAGQVYAPAQDSYFLMQTLVTKKHLLSSGVQNILELGCGSGYIIEALHVLFPEAKLHALDCNPHAIHATKIRVPHARVELSHIHAHKKKHASSYDLIVSNPPYLPQGKYDGSDYLSKALIGGKKGWETAVHVIERAAHDLSVDGSFVLLISSLTNPGVVEKCLFEHGFCVKAKETQYVGMHEELLVYICEFFEGVKFAKKQRIEIGSYLAHGKRGIVFKGKYKKKVCVIKIALHDDNMALKESKMLMKVEKLHLAPKLFCAHPSFVCMEYVEGKPLGTWLESITPKRALPVLSKIIVAAARLDKAQIAKEEMTYPYKHIIVTPTNKVVFIDFERSRSKERVNNVGQFCSFLCTSHTPVALQAGKTRPLVVQYLTSGSVAPILAHISSVYSSRGTRAKTKK